jgi:predicted aconitase with swiveling domain/8-oxo-dGTP pyrophosphatase MutT (NUDIX family)
VLAEGRLPDYRGIAGDDILILKGRGISKGRGEGEIVLSESPVSFLGGVDPVTGALAGRQGEGASIRGRVFAFPHGKGSTVGSYVLLEMKRQGTLPAAIINAVAEPIVATGSVMAHVPMIDRIDIALLREGDRAVVDGEQGTLELPEVRETHVVSCVVQDGERLLLLKRSEKVGTFQGYWAAVSGFVEENETPSQTACKELREETGLDMSFSKEGRTVTVRDRNTVWHVHPYLFRATDPVVEIDWEHTEFSWVRPQELEGYQTVPGLVEIVRDLL